MRESSDLLFASPLAFLQRLAGLGGGHPLARQQPLAALINRLQQQGAATAGAPGTGRETQGAVVNGTVVCKGLAGAELMAREATPTPKAARAISRANLPWGADWINSAG